PHCTCRNVLENESMRSRPPNGLSKANEYE
ncbi:unnamed protein product, partial [Mesorhabditis spiculigera]